MSNFANPYQDANAFSGAANAFSEALLELPLRKRAQAMQMLQLQLEQARMLQEGRLGQQQLDVSRQNAASEADYRKAHGKLFGAQAEAAQNKSALELARLAAAGNLQGAVRQATMPPGMAPYDVPTQEQSQGVGRANVAGLKAMIDALGGKTSINVPAGATETVGGVPLYQSPRIIPKDQVMVPGGGGQPIAEGVRTPPKVELTPEQQMVKSLGGAAMNPLQSKRDPTVHSVLGMVKQVVDKLMAPTNAPAVGPMQGQPQGQLQLNSPEDVKAAVAAGKMDKATAKQILQQKFGFE